MKKFLIVFLMFASLACFAQTGTAQNTMPAANLDVEGEPEILKSERIQIIKNNRTKITIRSNVNNAAVFLNGQFEGNTDLTISDLPAGRYSLRIEKQGYEPKRYIISVRAGQEETFYVELTKYEGYVTFNSKPQNCQISVDGSTISSDTVLLQEGEHTVTARCFGYKEESRTIYVFRRTYQVVSFELEEAPFDILNLKTSRSSFNPSLKGSPGKIKFSFYATNRGTATVTIQDQMSNMVGIFELAEFTTWSQGVTWDGRDSRGLICGDGVYTVSVDSADKHLEQTFTIDSTIKLPSVTLTPGGSGIGNLPQAFRLPKSTFALELSGGAVLSDIDGTIPLYNEDSGEPFYAGPLSLGLLYCPLDFLEFSLKGALLLGYPKTPGLITGAAKFAFRNRMSHGDLDWGFTVRAGRTGAGTWEPYGADTGNGLSIGGLLGWDAGVIYAGLTSQAVWYSTAGTDNEGSDFVWNNGLALQLNTELVSAGLWGSLSSSFGHSKRVNDLRTKNDWTRAAETGLDLHVRPFEASFMINAGVSTLLFEKAKYLKITAGVTVII
jgi:hypothetical protein